MKKLGKSSKKGFTLVELIVVLVILAVLAAMLVPALTGYIKRARQEKDYQMAATVLTAAQAAATYQMTLAKPDNPIKETTRSSANGDTVQELVGNTNFTCSFTYDGTTFVIDKGDVVIGNYTYHWDASSVAWTAS